MPNGQQKSWLDMEKTMGCVVFRYLKYRWLSSHWRRTAKGALSAVASILSLKKSCLIYANTNRIALVAFRTFFSGAFADVAEEVLINIVASELISTFFVLSVRGELETHTELVVFRPFFIARFHVWAWSSVEWYGKNNKYSIPTNKRASSCFICII